jgi:hypothetical protein
VIATAILYTWLAGMGVFIALSATGLVYGLSIGKITFTGYDTWRLRADYLLQWAPMWIGQTLCWPAVALQFFLQTRSKSATEIQDEILQHDLGSKTIQLPPQDERSLEQAAALRLALEADLKATLGVRALVKFHPLLWLAWEEFEKGFREEFPSHAHEAPAIFAGVAMNLARGNDKQ